MGPVTSGAPPTVLVGRDAEMDRVTRFVRSAGQPGHAPAAMVVEGDLGMGKTALGAAIAHREAESGATVLFAAGVQSEVDIGFAGLSQLLSPVVDRVGQLPTGLRDDLSAALGYDELISERAPQVAAAVLFLLKDLGRSARAVVIVDDVQYIDSATADVLGRAARSVGVANVRLVVLQRAGSQTYFDTSGLPRLTLLPLPDAQAEALVKSHYPGIDQLVLARVLSVSHGNPLALLQLPTALNAFQLRAVEALPTHLPLTERLQRLYGQRVLSLPPATRHLLLVDALGGSELSVLGLDWSERLRVLAPAERIGGLVELDRGVGTLRFLHPLVRSTVIDLSTAHDRRQAHAVLAMSSAADADQAAWHLAAATLAPDEAVAASLEAAARRALARGDAAGAVRALLRAAELSPDAGDRSRRVADAAYRGAHVGGDLPRAARLLEDADRAVPGARQTLEGAVATAYLLLNGAGDTQTAHRVVVAALESAERTNSAEAETVAEAVHTLCEICLYADQPALWPAYHASMKLVPLDRFPVLALWDQVMVDPARSALAALPTLDRALHSLDGERDPVRVERVATAAVFVDRVELARAPLQRLVEDARLGSAVAPGIVALILLSAEAFHRGRWTFARDAAEEGMQLVTEYGFDLLAWPLRLTQAWLAASTGDHDRVGVLLDQMHAWATPRQIGTVLHYAHHGAGLDALARGNYEAAFRSLSEISSPGDLRTNVGAALWAAMDLVEAAVHSGHQNAAAAHVTAMREAGVAKLSGRLQLAVAGSIAMAAEPLDRALFDRALRTPGAEQWPFQLARIQLCYGQLLRRERAAAAARPHLSSALATFVELGARPWAERAEQELEATSRSKKRPQRSDADTPLTPQERHVATLASRGMTNKEIASQLLISPRTVGAHLQSVYRKLDVASRGGLHRAMAAPASPLPPLHHD